MTSLPSGEILRCVRDLPALPAVVMELMQSLEDHRINADQLAVKISHDQALAAKTLRLANSSFYGMSRRVTSISEATAILGLRTLRNVAMAAGLAGSFSGLSCRGFDFEAFWRHAIGTALCAQALAQAVQLDEDEAFTLGLLHDVGRLVMVSGHAERYAKVLDCQREQDCLMYVAERSIFGTDHAAVGSLVAEHWHFNPMIVAAIAGHHEVPQATAKCLTDIVHVADNMAHALDLSHLENDMVPPLVMSAWARLALTEGLCTQVFLTVESQHEHVCTALLG